MRLSSKGQYAVRAIIDLSYYSKNNLIPISLKDIAERESISIHYLEQIFFTLKKAGIVRSLRGPNGGYVLNKKPSDILIGDIIASVEPIEIISCISKAKNKKECERKSICLAFDMWNSISTKITGFLNSITIEDVINEYKQKSNRKLLEKPAKISAKNC
ncbi:MAG: RrF2 family transcriptional regulator [Candidatus Acidulodesulfobacterium ferriphilum]|jgi:Rrf2 family protein|uniref:RrF2 family transcriptional regulator n=1 Tax=Candidatus Acidulodesulfobacterium ferriphilum TaxID=2597223 RepID=A0A519BC78_9DELT|nr:MAG: RrF2 family transcriptional regulator [Candidatus Acidulodesulfobacterium ferriphilum]